MTIELYPPLALNELGQREGNEDSIYPPIGGLGNGVESKLFLVCDGVGGAEKGEEASRIACETFAKCFSGKQAIEDGDIEAAISVTEQAMDAYIEQNPESAGMATTLTLVFFDGGGAKIAHVGDSRVYHIRGGEVLFKTFDHSLVNELVQNNIITEEQAKSHPKKNVVTRAIMGVQRPTKADTARIADLREGDYFFLCTDGILESVTDKQLVGILEKNDLSEAEKLDEIFTLCQQKSRDNYSAYLLKVRSVSSAAQHESVAPVLESPKEAAHKRGHRIINWLLIAAALATTVQVVLYLTSLKKEKTIPRETPEWIDAYFAEQARADAALEDSIRMQHTYILSLEAQGQGSEVQGDTSASDNSGK